MPVQGAIERYQVRPGKQFRLDAVNPGEKTLFEEGGKEDHEPHFESLKDEMRELQKVLYAENKHRVLVVIQAMDTGGKDGCIQSVFSRVDPQGIHVVSFKKPSPHELAHDFLWRIHPHVPSNGQLVVFNRSHYEDIIAVRVKKLFPDEVWKRRQRHVVEFERMLAEEGTTIIKIFLHISKEEQKARLESRLANPAKHWKFDPDDLRDRGQWDDFMKTYQETIGETSTACAPWYVVPADRKWYRNLCVGRIVVDTLSGLGMGYPKISWDPSRVVVGE